MRARGAAAGPRHASTEADTVADAEADAVADAVADAAADAAADAEADTVADAARRRGKADQRAGPAVASPRQLVEHPRDPIRLVEQLLVRRQVAHRVRRDVAGPSFVGAAHRVLEPVAPFAVALPRALRRVEQHARERPPQLIGEPR